MQPPPLPYVQKNKLQTGQAGACSISAHASSPPPHPTHFNHHRTKPTQITSPASNLNPVMTPAWPHALGCARHDDRDACQHQHCSHHTEPWLLLVLLHPTLKQVLVRPQLEPQVAAVAAGSKQRDREEGAAWQVSVVVDNAGEIWLCGKLMGCSVTQLQCGKCWLDQAMAETAEGFSRSGTVNGDTAQLNKRLVRVAHINSPAETGQKAVQGCCIAVFQVVALEQTASGSSQVDRRM